MASTVRCRLEAAALALAGDVDAATRASVSQVHCKAICQMLRPIVASLSDMDIADLSGLASGVPWCGTDGQTIQAALCASVRVEPTGAQRKRRAMQDLTPFMSFFTEAEWGQLLNERLDAV